MQTEKTSGQRPSLDIRDPLALAAETLCAALGAEGCVIYLKEGVEYRLRHPEGCGVQDAFSRLRPPEDPPECYQSADRSGWPEGADPSCREAGWFFLEGAQGPVAAAFLWWRETPQFPEAAELTELSRQEGDRLESAQMFAQVERAKRQWESTVDALNEGIAVVSIHSGRILRANWALARQLGTSPGEMVGEDLEVRVLQPLGLLGQGMLQFARGRSEMEVEAKGVTWRIVQYPLEDSEAGVVILEDVTERYRAHTELVRAHTKIQESMERLRSTQAQLVQSEKMAAVGQLVSGVAHELNNPLTSVLGFSQLLERVTDEEKRKTFIATINKEAERARKIVQNLLTFARKRKPEKRALDINDVVLQTLELKSYELRVSGVTLETDLAENLPETSGDFQQLQQVLLNLLHNAVQALLSHGKEGRIRVRTRLRGEGEPGEPGVKTPSLVLEVEDNGPGVPEAHRNRIFEPFYTTKEVGDGTGLGLSLAYGILQEHGGNIRAEAPEADEYGGARFVMEIPVVAVETRRETPSLAVAATGPVRRILVVDDEESIRTMLREILEEDGHTVATAGDGRGALDALHADESFDLVLTDLKMPVLDGYGLYDEIRKQNPDLAQRVVFITGDTVSRETLSFLMRAGNPYLPKPLNLSKLREVVRSVSG